MNEMKRLVYGLAVVVVGLTLALGAPVAEATGDAQQVCPPDAVRSGDLCMDQFEASVWQTTDAALIAKIQDGIVTTDDLINAGAVQLGLAVGDLAAAGCPNTGNGCTNVFAVSNPGVIPSRVLTWFQAAAAARNSGKRLPTNAEWQAAALGTPDPGTDDEATDCNIFGPPFAVTDTGSRSNCVSDAGAFDLVGNVWEWVADWVPHSTACVPALFAGTGDTNCLAGASTSRGPAALFRGGGFASSTVAGVFAVRGFSAPSDANFAIGFRAAR